jgi:hypothetical protein
MTNGHTISYQPGRPVPEYRSTGPEPMGTERGDLTEAMLATDIWTDQMLAESGIPVYDIPLLSIGGGMGSFALYHVLRVAGLEPDSYRAVSDIDAPYETYQYLCRNSQIPDFERIRSDSGSVMDNIWGFPGYAIRECFDRQLRHEAGLRGITKALAPVWNVLVEPIGVDYYTPMAGQVFKSIRREMARLDWHRVLVKGTARVVRRRHGGGYFTVITPPAGTSATKRVAWRSRWVHVSIGYPGLRFLPDLQTYRETYKDVFSVVNAYEDHEHVYKHLIEHPGVVIVRGSGIVGSRILQRLIDDRDRHGAQTQIWHVFRNYVTGPHGDGIFHRRKGGDGFAYQGFNFAKSGWGGQLFDKTYRTEDPIERAKAVRSTGGTNTPKRKLWQQQLARGRREGWYKQYQGEVDEVVPAEGGGTITRVRSRDGALLELKASFIIDATGLEADPREHRLLADLLDHSNAGTNGMGRLDVDRSFRIKGTQSEPGGVIYASGAATLGGHLAPVDSFLGLQMVALFIADDLARQGLVSKIGPIRSVRQWTRWARNKRP